MLAFALHRSAWKPILGRMRAQSLLVLVTALAVSLALAGGAEARTKHKARAHGPAFVPTAAAFVMDAYSGRVLYSDNADTQTYPASLTKVMTLYLLFEQLRQGKVSLDSRIPVSAHAANQAPSRLGLRPGQTIRVQDAILAIVTKSANDVAVAIGEYLGGTEKQFAQRMTAKARALGMTRTQYMNASGLPNRGQLTTARDQALLAKRIQTDFPGYFAYFSTPEFAWDGRIIRNHNHLLGKYEGANGLKTGYTAASGFNLTTTVTRDNKSLIGVVLGGKTAKARDIRMVSILDRALPKAVAMRDTGTRLASAKPAQNPAGISDRDRQALASLAADEPDPDEESYTGTEQVASLTAAEPAAPVVVSTPVHPAAAAVAPANPVATPAKIASAPIAAPAKAAPVQVAAAEQPEISIIPAPRPAGPAAEVAVAKPAAAPIDHATAFALAALKKAEGPVRQAGRQIGNFIVTPAQASEGPQRTQAVAQLGTPPRRLDLRSGVNEAAPHAGRGWTAGDPLIPEGSWVIQIGAFADQADAVDRIRFAIKAAPELSKAVPVTLPVKTADNRTLYRSRFGGFDDEKEARNACGRLARESISCIAIPPANWTMPQTAREKAPS